MKSGFKKIGFFVLILLALVGLVIIYDLFVLGGVWLADKLYPWILIATAITIVISVLIFLPLAFFRSSRAVAGAGLYYASCVFGLSLWAWSLLVTNFLWGTTGVVIGLFLGGIGVIPMAILATLFKGMWSLMGELVLSVIVVYAVRVTGFSLRMKAERDKLFFDIAPNAVVEPPLLQNDDDIPKSL